MLTFVFSDCFLVAFGRGARQDADPKRLLEAALIQRLVSEWSSHPRWLRRCSAGICCPLRGGIPARVTDRIRD